MNFNDNHLNYIENIYRRIYKTITNNPNVKFSIIGDIHADIKSLNMTIQDLRLRKFLKIIILN